MSTQAVPQVQMASKLFCEPCRSRGKTGPAEKYVAGTWMCMYHFLGEDEFERMKARKVYQRDVRGTLSDARRVLAANAREARLYRRFEETKHLAEPYMAKLDAKPKCAKCGKPSESVGFCKGCQTRVQAIQQIRSWLKGYKFKGDKRRLQNAVAAIRRHQITPEELEG